MQGVYVITDEALFPGRTHCEIARAAIRGGARIIQLRDKNATDRAFYEVALQMRHITSVAGTAFFVNDRVDVAAAVGADGVNVGQTDLPVSAVRRLLPDGAVVGVSAADIDQALQAEADGADYVGFGPVFPTNTKQDVGPVSGLETLRQVVRAISIPVVAIGGIGLDNIKSVAEAGAACAAVVSAVVCAPNPAAAVRDLVNKWESGSRIQP